MSKEHKPRDKDDNRESKSLQIKVSKRKSHSSDHQQHAHGTSGPSESLPEANSNEDGLDRKTTKHGTDLTIKSNIGLSEQKSNEPTTPREVTQVDIETMTGNAPAYMQQITGALMADNAESFDKNLTATKSTKQSFNRHSGASTAATNDTGSSASAELNTLVSTAVGAGSNMVGMPTATAPAASNQPQPSTTASAPPATPAAATAAQTSAPGPMFVCPPALRERGYEISDEIGGGAFSKVYRARYKQLADKEIAVKIIALDKVPEVWREKCLRQELRIVRKLQHPHIIKVWDIIKTRRNVFIFMDLAENNSVLHYMQSQNKQLPENVARVWFTQTTGAILYMHTKGIAHRDLKNENILLDRDYNVKLTDFGFACYAIDVNSKQAVMSPTCCGTIAYIAPEVLNPPYEARSADIWSLGVCLFEMVTFQKPFEDPGNHRKLLKMQMNRAYHYPSSSDIKISDEVKDLINKMLEPEVDQRLTAMQILQHSWIMSGYGNRS